MNKFGETFLLWIIKRIGAPVIALYSRTFRFSFQGIEQVDSLFKDKKNFIYALWHGRMFPLIFFHRTQNLEVIISQHRDGEIVSNIVEKLGYSTVRGSSTSGGSKALLTLLQHLHQNMNYVFTPDGPRGPEQKVKQGVIYFASRSGLPIIPLTAAAQSYFTIKSWDTFIIPKPFSKISIIYGKPYYIHSQLANGELDSQCVSLEDKLRNITALADKDVGGN